MRNSQRALAFEMDRRHRLAYIEWLQRQKPEPESPPPPPPPPMVRGSVSYWKRELQANGINETIWPYLHLSRAQELAGERARIQLEDDNVRGEPFLSCTACGDATARSYEWNQGQWWLGSNSICRGCARFIARRLTDDDGPISDPRNGPVTTSFDAELARRAPVEGRSVRPDELIADEQISEWIVTLLNTAVTT